VAAALLLVLQSLAGAVAQAQAPGQVDLFGNALCATGPDPSPSPDHGGHGKSLPDCCVAGCSMFAAFCPEPNADAASWLQWPVDARPLPKRDEASAPSLDRHAPGRPRAPPLTA
jgi:hypothetical protein